MISEGGFAEEGIFALTGIPVFRYSTVVGDTTFIQTLLAADLNNNIMGANTGSGGDTSKNICNISNSHAYSLLAVFNITATNGTKIPVLMIRNPWGTCGSSCYNGTLKSTDTFWTASMIS